MNPPFRYAGEFVSHALNLAPYVCVLARLAFLESRRRTAILDGGYLARVLLFSNRLLMMHRDGWDGPRATSSVAFAWFVWDRTKYGPTVLKRIVWTDE